MDDLDFSQDYFTEFERYMIGFTENQYSKSKDRSPSPVDHTPRHSSLALEYAERSNKNAENVFQDISLILDRQKTKSVNKINGNKLDLVFELTERRKTSNPLQRSLNASMDSNGRMSDDFPEIYEPIASPTFPTIEVQQLPPLSQPMESLPILPDIHIEPVSYTQVPKKKKKPGNANRNRNVKNNQMSSDVKTPKLVYVVKEAARKHKAASKSEVNKHDSKDSTNEKLEKSENVELPAMVNIAEKESVDKKEHKYVKWQNMTNRLVDTMRRVKESPEDFNGYRRLHSISRQSDLSRKSSFCQSSYQERAERERAYNIRRRHSLQTKTGPLDFNKLRRQISFGRSRTMIW